jgi:hypothetical protein
MSARRPTRWLVRLYPSSWRSRYEEEFLALLEDVRLTAPVVADVVVTAAVAHVDEWIVRPRADGWRDAALTEKGIAMIRILLTLLVLGTTAMAAFGTLHAVWFDSDVSAFRAFAAVSFAVPVAVGVLTLLALVQVAPTTRGRLARPTAMAALLLIPLGVIGVIAVLLIGYSSGDYEWAIVTTNAALVVQGALTALYFSDRIGGRGLLTS